MVNTQKDSSVVSVDLIRVVAIVAVVFLHAVVYATNDIVASVGSFGVLRGWFVVVCLCFGRVGVPLFIMLTGALLLVPSKKDEGLEVFFKKRFSRIGLPFLFWGVVYFVGAVC